MIYPINPNTKPRMTRADKWKKRKCVLQYWAFKDEVKLRGVTIPEDGALIIFYVPMAKSWSKKKKALFEGKPHRNTPDIDNLAKGLLDAIYKDDALIWNLHIIKVWSYEGAIEIKQI